MNLTFDWFGKVTLAGIEPVTFWLFMWCSTHCAKVSVKLWNCFKVSRLQPMWFELTYHCQKFLNTQILILGIQIHFYFTKLGQKRTKGHTIRKCTDTWHDGGYSHLNSLCSYSGMLSIFNVEHQFTFCAIKVCFAFSSSPIFSRTDTARTSERFYNTILELSELTEEREEINELLTWWNQFVFYHLFS